MLRVGVGPAALVLVLCAALAGPAQAHDSAVVADGAFSGSLPVGPGQTAVVSQGNDQGDHIGVQRYAFDFVVGQQNFVITAAQSGTVIGLDDSSDIQCSGLGMESAPVSQPLPGCWAHANFILIKDDDGVTASLYMHLLQGSACSAQFCVTLGEHVTQGQPLARAGTTGWSTGVHLHFQAEVPPVPQQDPYSGWWFTSSVPAHFTNAEVTAQDGDGVPRTGQAFRLGAASPPASPAVAWQSRSYDLTCDTIAQAPVSVAFHDGTGTATGPGIGSYARWDLSIQQVAQGVLPSLGGVTAVLFSCSPQPSNFSVQELRVYRTGDGSEIGRVPDVPSSGAGGLPGIFQPGSVAVGSGQVSADVKLYGPGDSHASGPSILRHLSWSWDGQGFAGTSPQSQAAATGTCPDSAGLLRAWNGAPAALRSAWAGVQITGFNGITCWNGWVVAVPESPSAGNGVIVFSLTDAVHLITIAELQHQFRDAVCSSPDAPPGWTNPPVVSCH